MKKLKFTKNWRAYKRNEKVVFDSRMADIIMKLGVAEVYVAPRDKEPVKQDTVNETPPKRPRGRPPKNTYQTREMKAEQ